MTVSYESEERLRLNKINDARINLENAELAFVKAYSACKLAKATRDDAADYQKRVLIENAPDQVESSPLFPPTMGTVVASSLSEFQPGDLHDDEIEEVIEEVIEVHYPTLTEFMSESINELDVDDFIIDSLILRGYLTIGSLMEWNAMGRSFQAIDGRLTPMMIAELEIGLQDFMDVLGSNHDLGTLNCNKPANPHDDFPPPGTVLVEEADEIVVAPEVLKTIEQMVARNKDPEADPEADREADREADPTDPISTRTVIENLYYAFNHRAGSEEMWSNLAATGVSDINLAKVLNKEFISADDLSSMHIVDGFSVVWFDGKKPAVLVNMPNGIQTFQGKSLLTATRQVLSLPTIAHSTKSMGKKSKTDPLVEQSINAKLI